MPLPTKPEAEINSDDGGQNKEIDSDSCSSYTDSDSESSSDSEAADMYWKSVVSLGARCGLFKRCLALPLDKPLLLKIKELVGHDTF